MTQNAEQPIAPETARFYDGGVDADKGQPEVLPDPASRARIELVRTTENGCEEFKMQRRIAYNDRHLGELLVPRRTRTFCSDLTSVPTLFTWLVPKTGEHLPATLLHDGLIHPSGDPTYTSTNGHVVHRVEADRVLRDAMADAGTALIRRWLIWSAVAMATMLDGSGTGWSKGRKWYYRLTAGVTLLLVFALGIYAFFDLFDAHIPKLPWMGDRPWFVEVVGGLSGAVVIPLVLALFWGRFRIARRGCGGEPRGAAARHGRSARPDPDLPVAGTHCEGAEVGTRAGTRAGGGGARGMAHLESPPTLSRRSESRCDQNSGRSHCLWAAVRSPAHAVPDRRPRGTAHSPDGLQRTARPAQRHLLLASVHGATPRFRAGLGGHGAWPSPIHGARWSRALSGSRTTGSISRK